LDIILLQTRAREESMFWAVRAFQVVLAIGIVLISALGAAADKRVALVIGNGAYTSLPGLPNPANDARDITALLRDLGFEVLEGIDLNRSGVVTLTGEFLDGARGADAALIYYAGHGIQYEEDNYLIPVDASVTSAFGLKSEAVSLKGLLSELEGLAKINLVFLDACRDNPLAEKLAATSPTRSGRSRSRGLARVDPSSADTLIAFAAAPGQVALDGTDRNSPFATAFLRHVATSRDEISILFKSIARDVLDATRNEQHPQIVSAMTVNFYFQGGDATVTVNEGGGAQAAYDAAARIGTERAFQAVVDGFPNTVQANLALAAIEQMHQQTGADTVAAPQSHLASASLIENGSFERIDMETWAGGFWTPNGGSAAIPGWTVTGVSVDYVVAPYWQASDGIASLDLNGTTVVNGAYQGGVSQTFATVAGQQYVVKFDLAGNPDARVQNLVVTAPGETQSYSFNTAGKTLAAMGYTTEQFSFTATGATSTLTFASADGSGDYQGPVIDNVVVTHQ
jgi:choice-of-anchor C domain-containing protein